VSLGQGKGKRKEDPVAQLPRTFCESNNNFTHAQPLLLLLLLAQVMAHYGKSMPFNPSAA